MCGCFCCCCWFSLVVGIEEVGVFLFLDFFVVVVGVVVVGVEDEVVVVFFGFFGFVMMRNWCDCVFK